MKREKYRGQLLSVQRRGLLRVISAYRTTSDEAAQVISGYPPIDLMVAEVCYLFKVGTRLEGNRRMARRRTYDKWQDRWAGSQVNAGWTKILIPDIRDWVECGHKRTGYFFTQFLTGHGSFGTYTKIIGKTVDDMCAVCSVQDSPEHVYASCERWRKEREKLEEYIGYIPDVREVVPCMLEEKKRWNAIHDYVTEIMSRKEREDREKQQR